MNITVPFFKPSIGNEEKAAALRVLDSGWLTTAKESLAFEKEFANFVGAKYALSVNSATSGLVLSLEACGIGPGTKILTTPYTFISTATAARHVGAEVVYADIEKDTYSLDPIQIEKKLQEDTTIKAIIPVHIAGNVCNMNAINKIASRYNVAVIEDAAHSFPSKTQFSAKIPYEKENGFAGTLGTTGVYSFYATKTITTGEGGMICTNDEKLAKHIKIMRMHGINREVWDRYTSKNASWKYDVVAEGWKYNLPDLLSAIGREQLKKAQSFFTKRRAIAYTYTDAFKNCPFLECPPDQEGNAWHLYLLRIKEEKLSIDRDEFAALLQEKGIGISVHFIPHYELTYTKNRYNLKAESFPECHKKYTKTISIPLWPDMTKEMIDHVIATVLWVGESHGL